MTTTPITVETKSHGPEMNESNSFFALINYNPEWTPFTRIKYEKTKKILCVQNLSESQGIFIPRDTEILSGLLVCLNNSYRYNTFPGEDISPADLKYTFEVIKKRSSLNNIPSLQIFLQTCLNSCNDYSGNRFFKRQYIKRTNKRKKSIN
ncbi:hypothetical protein MXB_4796 [Myxobolus squamalis]|nr:hypothetical protein MXB_4796 [Myxobolus squamalis]